MTKTPDFAKAFENMFSALPTDMKAFDMKTFDMTAFTDAFQNSAELSGKMAKIALEAAEKNAELSQAWTKDTLSKLEATTAVQKDPSDYAKVVSDIASSQSQSAPEHIAAFAEVAKKAQMDTVELMLAAGNNARDEAESVVKKATKKAA